MNIIVLKLISGEEVIAELDMETESTMIINRPRIMKLMHNQDGSIAGGLMPYLISDPDKKGISLNKSAVACSFSASADLSNSYISATTTLILG